ncbi:hypothetical protein [uncultured Pedobacter sp.]|uniref:hypothetical protein n=1 Tax=uncultured Pedobacter sp. TaxID=246139 RepID=UPI0025E24DCA|nr:hypothetical protein [uncultured Pedobacter sp.]
MNSILANLLSLTPIIPPCIVFGACCFFLIKKSSVEAILMTIGSGIALIVNILYSFLMPLLMAAQNLTPTEVIRYNTIVGVISFTAGLCFAAGLLILVINTVKKNKVIYNQFPKSND